MDRIKELVLKECWCEEEILTLKTNIMDTKNYFKELNEVKCIIEKKQWLNYVSWSDARSEVKKKYPDSNYVIYENNEWFPFRVSSFWIDVKVWVTIEKKEHIVRLPVMDWAMKSMKDVEYSYKIKDWDETKKQKKDIFKERLVEPATQTDINKAIQRAFTKAIAMHWIGLYVYRGEDLPEEPVKEQFWQKERDELEKQTDKKKYLWELKKTHEFNDERLAKIKELLK